MPDSPLANLGSPMREGRPSVMDVKTERKTWGASFFGKTVIWQNLHHQRLLRAASAQQRIYGFWHQAAGNAALGTVGVILIRSFPGGSCVATNTSRVTFPLLRNVS